jgi:ribosome maturation factor RimP
MITKEQIQTLAESFLEESDKFLVDIKVSKSNSIHISIDGDQGILIEDCIKLSRHIESSLDREAEDFELEVSSAGASQPLKFQRQYPRHKGRSLIVLLADNSKTSGVLTQVTDKGIELQPAAPKKKKQESDPIPVFIPWEQIQEAKIEIAFK